MDKSVGIFILNNCRNGDILVINARLTGIVVDIGDVVGVGVELDYFPGLSWDHCVHHCAVIVECLCYAYSTSRIEWSVGIFWLWLLIEPTTGNFYFSYTHIKCT